MAREIRVDRARKDKREGRRPPMERRERVEGTRYYPDPLSLTVHDALDFCSFVCFSFAKESTIFLIGAISLSERRRRTAHEVD